MQDTPKNTEEVALAALGLQPGDEVIILSLDQMTRDEAAQIEHKVVHVDAKNQVLRVDVKTPSYKAKPQS